jgi:multidrug efflux pump subunit AcrA (membrane-fusion protein)
MNFHRGIKIILPIVIIAIAVGVFQHLKASKPERKKPELKEKVWQVEVIPALKQNLAPSIGLYGRVESPELLQAAAPGAGIVSEVLVRSGTQVSPGELLVKMDRRDFESTLVQAETDLQDINNQISELKIRHRSNLNALKTERQLLQLANDEVDRLLKLKQQNLTADTILNIARSAQGRQQLSVISREYEVESFPAQLGKLQARLKHNRAKLEEARLMIERSEVFAPFQAVISATPVSVGDRVDTGQILVSLYPVNSLEIRAHIPSRYIAGIQQAISSGVTQGASITLPGKILQLELVRLAGEAEPSGIDAYFRAGESSTSLRLGALLPLSFNLPVENSVIAIPYQAIYGNSRLYLLQDNRLQGVDVESIGQYSDRDGSALLLVKSTKINSDDEIVITHLPNAVSGLKVRSEADDASR